MPQKKEAGGQTDSEVEALSVVCPVCAVPAGEACDPRIPGAALKKTHLERVRVAVGD